MENNENKKTKNPKKLLIAFIIVLVLVLAIAIPVTILMQDKSPKKDTDKELKGPKNVKEQQCTKKGELCTFEQMYEGVEVNVEVAEGKTYTFSMIANSRETMTLMLQENIIDDIEWDSEGSNQKGPSTSLYEVNQKVKEWTNIEDILSYNYTDKGKVTSETLCAQAGEHDEYECPKDQYDKRGYTGLTITNGEIKLLFNLPPDRDPEPGFEVLKEGFVQGTAKARLITLEEYEEFVTEDGTAKWLIENLDKNEGYWTMTSSHKLTTGYNHAAVAIINRDKKPDTEDVPVARGNQYFKVGVRPVITIYKK